jgi:acetolactate synthase-1/2/3 large subunit
MNIQREVAPVKLKEIVKSGEPDRSTAQSWRLEQLAEDVRTARRPILYLGNGMRGLRGQVSLQQLIEDVGIPFLVSWSALDLIEDSHPLNLGRVGIYGDRAAIILLQKADLVVCLGTRLAIPQVGYHFDDFARLARLWIVDIDSDELAKFANSGRERTELVHGCCRDAMTRVHALLAAGPPRDISDWLEDCDRVWNYLPRRVEDPVNHMYVHSGDVIQALNNCAPKDAIITTDVGAGLLSGHHFLEVRKGQRIFTSQGLGEMGFGLPAAIGAALAEPKRPIICLSTDGGIMFNLQELATARENAARLYLFVFNNNGYAMIKASQKNLFGGRLAGVDSSSGISFPDFRIMAEAFGFEYLQIKNSVNLF